MLTTGTTPGLRYVEQAPAATLSPLRSDIAGFIGRTRRGPIGQAVRVSGWREFQARFGGLQRGAVTPYALQGYFQNDGDVAHVLRVGGAHTTAAGDCPQLGWHLVASSPGSWANGTCVRITSRPGIGGSPVLDIIVKTKGEPVEYFTALDPATAPDRLAQASNLILVPSPPPPGGAVPFFQCKLALQGGSESAPDLGAYLDAAQALGDEGEVAFTTLPDLYGDLPDPISHRAVLQTLLLQAEVLHDRMVLVDLPLPPSGRSDETGFMAQWIGQLIALVPSNSFAQRAAALYHPPLLVPDPLGSAAHPLLAIPPSGHVAGIISSLDRQRGADHTPANALLTGAVDIPTELEPEAEALLRGLGLNLIRCAPGKGLTVWGGRTLQSDPGQPSYLAHRRLVHRLVRAIRRVAEPLVFEVNGPDLWLTLVRAITAVLLEAYNGGGLQGNRPEDAFSVRCDATTNPPDGVDAGRCVCEIQVAPAVPMEIITLRVALSQDGSLDVVES